MNSKEIKNDICGENLGEGAESVELTYTEGAKPLAQAPSAHLDDAPKEKTVLLYTTAAKVILNLVFSLCSAAAFILLGLSLITEHAFVNVDGHAEYIDSFVHSEKDMVTMQAAAILLAGAALAALVVLICGAGHARGSKELSAGIFTKMRTEFFAAALLAQLFVFVIVSSDVPIQINEYNITALIYGGSITERWVAFLVIAACVAAVFAITATVMGLLAKIKLRTLLSDSVVFAMLRHIWAFLKKFAKGCSKALVLLFTGTPGKAKILLAFCGFILLEFVFFLIVGVIGGIDGEVDALIWIIIELHLFLIIGTFWLGSQVRPLVEGAKAMSSGDLCHPIDTSRLTLGFKEHGENLKKISAGMSVAVEERLRSERMKTELITNVSHDIKTPLTSIINYTDLLASEKLENPKAVEYLEVLSRQSQRLKRLIDDLVEASKAQSGNLEIIFSQCELGTVLTQAAGEYEQKFTDRELNLVLKKPEEKVLILADGRRIWRIFDNLMGNIAKYAQSGTRVYITLETVGKMAQITFKNTSFAELNMSPEELMERFTRGDASRNTDGNGLGLSIAKSLTELQKGTLSIAIDGDLFKAILQFPLFNAGSDTPTRDVTLSRYLR